MSDTHQELSRKAWTEGRAGTVSALSEAKAWALREVWRSEGNCDWGLVKFAAERVTKVGGGNPHPPALSKFFAKVDKDPDWFPCNSAQEQCGPAPALSGQAKTAIAQAAMAMKKRKVEPTFPRIVAACPTAIINPATGKPVDKRRV